MISVIIPLYNKQAILARTIESVKLQTYLDWELLIIDDGSTDGSSDVVVPYLSDKRIHYYKKPNGGVSSARNMGSDLAQGEWVCFLDADDYMLPNSLGILLELATKYQVDIATGNYFVERNGEYIPMLRGVREGIVKNSIRSLFLGKFDTRAGATIYKYSLNRKYRFDENLSRYEDGKIQFEILRNHKVAITPYCLMVYTTDYASLSLPCSNFAKDYISCMDFNDKPFWEKVFLGRFIKEGLSTYPFLKNEIKLIYKGKMRWMYIGRVLNYYVQLRNIIFYLRFKCKQSNVSFASLILNRIFCRRLINKSDIQK